jgi:hypothetical protein
VEDTNADSGMMAALYAALAVAQGQFQPIAKNRSVTIRSEKGNYAFRYADLEAVLAATRPALAANGLALLQTVVVNEDGRGWLVATLAHAKGGTLHSRLPLPDLSRLGDPKQFGGVLTYLRRYQINALLCVAADDDLDEDGEDAGTDARSIDNWRERPPPMPAPREKAKPEGDPQNPATITPGQIAWLTKKLAAVEDSAAVLDEFGIAEVSGAIDSKTFEKLKARLLRG